VLSAIINEHLVTGEPVGSRTISDRFAHASGWSPATIRNVMAELEELGLVEQPHTSAGRVPTDLGYRCYVDQILSERRAARPAPQIEERLRRAGTIEDVLSHASQEISRASHQVGFAIAPTTDLTFEHVDFVPLEGRKILVVLVAAGGQISHKVVEPDEAYDRESLQHAANYINAEFSGRTLAEVRQTVVDLLREERTLYDQLMARALRLASTTFEGLEPQPSIYIQGTSLLLDIAGGDDPETAVATMRTLLRMMEEKTRLVQLIDACMDGTGLTVVIGSEHPDPDLQRFSVVTSTYTDGRRTGTVGVIGPTRMRYSRTINVVDSLSRALNKVLEQS
jgi:heat-inducible transcriptional repressor